MKSLLVSIVAAVLVVGCSTTQSLHHAVQFGNTEAVKQYLDAGGDVNAKNKWENTPLHIAAWKGHEEVVELLIAKGADVNAKSVVGWTPLHNAAIYGHKEIAELLIAKGADVNVKTKFDETPLDLAIINNETETADLLREHGGKTTPEGYSDTIADDRTSAERRRTEIIGEVGRIGIGAAIERLTEEAVKSALP